jgi:abortive infection bacteriophage resistance protein
MPLHDAHFGGFSLFIGATNPFLMKYVKQPISINEQISKLQERGLEFPENINAGNYLSNISYYRLRAYTYPFQDNNNPDHPFIKKVSFEDIINLYVFDRQLRLLIFNAIEKIEISFRTQIIYHFALKYGSHWHTNPALYNDSVRFAEQINSLQIEIDRSHETFIKHYKEKYTQPKEPPCWMSLEVSSMGLLSKIFYNLKKDSCKDEITKHFGLKDVDVLENWMQCISLIRNICAHHGRIWNRRIKKITIAKKTLYPYISNKQILQYKIYPYLCNMQYILNIICPNHDFKTRLIELMKNCPLAQEKEMGFPAKWQEEELWK